MHKTWEDKNEAKLYIKHELYIALCDKKKGALVLLFYIEFSTTSLYILLPFVFQIDLEYGINKTFWEVTTYDLKLLVLMRALCCMSKALVEL